MIRVPVITAPRVPPLAGDPARWIAPWLVALMVYVASLAGIGLVVLNETLRASETLLMGRLTVQVPAEASAARVETILAVLRQTPGIRSVRPLTPAETGRLLEPWLGSSVPLQELPVPQLIDASRDPGGAVDMATLRHQLASVVPEVRIDEYGSIVDTLRARARPLQLLLGAAIAGALLLVAGLAMFTTGSALAARQSDVELLHLLGADDGQIARPYAARSLVYGLIGGIIAAAAISATVAALGGAGRLIRLAAPADAIGLADWRLWLVLAVVTALAGILAAASARATVRWRLARLP
ncbi:MAG: cell division protein FtsX [Alphaproteobacteria bacterium]